MVIEVVDVDCCVLCKSVNQPSMYEVYFECTRFKVVDQGLYDLGAGHKICELFERDE